MNGRKNKRLLLEEGKEVERNGRKGKIKDYKKQLLEEGKEVERKEGKGIRVRKEEVREVVCRIAYYLNFYNYNFIKKNFDYFRRMQNENSLIINQPFLNKIKN